MRKFIPVIAIPMVIFPWLLLTHDTSDTSARRVIHTIHTAPLIAGPEVSQVVEMGNAVAVAEAAYAAQVEAEAERQRLEAEQRARTAQSQNVAALVGQCCGPHSDAWWQGVAMCEQGGRNDPYFGYFSFMDGSQGGRSWDEQVAAGNELLARAGREIGPWAASCVAAGYAASPGG